MSAFAAALVLTMAVTQAPSLRAEPAAAAATQKAPLKHTFRKDKKANPEQPYVLTLKNTSEQSLKVSGQVLLAATSFAPDHARKIAEEVIAPGKSLKIKEIASVDKVTIKVEGYDPLELVAPKQRAKKAE